MRRQQIIERGDRTPPGQMPRHLQPFGVLVEHGIHDVDEGLVAGEEAVAAAELDLGPARQVVRRARFLRHGRVRRRVAGPRPHDPRGGHGTTSVLRAPHAHTL